jgi:hypothetical protein
MTRKKQPLSHTGKVTLTKVQQRAIIALAAQREQIATEANTALAEIVEALDELAQLYAQKANMPDGEYIFEQKGQVIGLMLRPEPVEETALESEKEVTD